MSVVLHRRRIFFCQSFNFHFTYDLRLPPRCDFFYLVKFCDYGNPKDTPFVSYVYFYKTFKIVVANLF